MDRWIKDLYKLYYNGVHIDRIVFDSNINRLIQSMHIKLSSDISLKDYINKQ